MNADYERDTVGRSLGRRRPTLFQRGDFTLHSGEKSGFKIDCDALTDTDIDTIAWMLANRLPLFGKVEGVPTGGLRLAAAMERYARPAQSGLLIVDDVWTTGRSMETHRDFRVGVMGAVIFARSPVPAWVTPLFMLAPTPTDDAGEALLPDEVVTPAPRQQVDEETLAALIDGGES